MRKRVDQFPHLNAIAGSISEQLEALSDDELEALKKECAETSVSNCGWVTYGLRSIVWQVADNHLAWRDSASATEAGTAKTENTGLAEGEGAVPKADAQ